MLTFLDEAQAKTLPESGYFIYKGDTLIGIGKIGDNIIEAVASLQRGAGGEAVSALAKCLFGQSVSLEVATQNTPAIALYERLGFAVTGEISSWYKIL